MEECDSVGDRFAGGGEKSIGLKKRRADGRCDGRRGRMRSGKIKGPQLSSGRAVTAKNDLITESDNDGIVMKSCDAAVVAKEADGEE